MSHTINSLEIEQLLLTPEAYRTISSLSGRSEGIL